MNLFVAVLLVVVVGSSDAFPRSKKEAGFPNWDALSVKFGGFFPQPIMEMEAMDEGWEMDRDACETPSFFLGRRYVLNGDRTTMLLFDNNGQIAGMQMRVPAGTPVMKNHIGTYFYEDLGDYYLTVYFVDPESVCNSIMMRDQLGDQLHLQRGKVIGGSVQTMSVQLKEKDLRSTKWIQGSCIRGMGQHYWYDVSETMNCDDFFPYFLLYNKGVLSGFGFVTFGHIEAKNLENPPTRHLPYFFNETPKCIVAPESSRTTQHVFLQSDPQLLIC